jgi:predicted phosphoribosyltransferase
MTFANREEAGQKLGRYLAGQGVRADLVLGLPRGGVLVAAEVAGILKCPLDTLVVRKIGHPRHREFAVGALAEDGTLVLDEEVLGRAGVKADELEQVVREETERLSVYSARFHRTDAPVIKGKAVLIVDDGLATGATTEAAVRSAKNQGAERVIVAAPVASDSAVERLQQAADRVIILFIDPGFDAVGRYYLSFPQATDAEVRKVLGMAD